MFWDRQKKMKIHLVGIGGSGMSGIAEVLLASGFEVSGSDLSDSPTTRRLQQLGATLYQSHQEQNLNDAHCVVVSSAVSPSNPEWKRAKAQGIPVIPRAEMLAELMRLKKGVAVAGSHGKTSTTSMIGQVLQALRPSVIVGGRLQNWNASSILGKGSTFVVEADESDRSFLRYSPVYSVVTNVDLEHLDNYKNLEDIQETFLKFLNRTAFFGQNWISADCPNLQTIRHRIIKPTKTYGFSENADLKIISSQFKNGMSLFQLRYEDQDLGEFQLPAAGRHNVMNASAAIGVGLSLGLGVQMMKKRLKSFVAADRRLQVHYSDQKHVVIEDYAHHPTEVRAAFQAIQEMHPSYKKVVVFQPHRYSRTKALWNDFVNVLKGQVDRLVLLPIYAAHEEKMPGVSSVDLAKAIGEHALFSEKIPENDADFLSLLSFEETQPCVFVFLGAAPLTNQAERLSRLLGIGKKCSESSGRKIDAS